MDGIEPLTLRPSPSRYLAIWLCGLHLLSQLVLWQLPMGVVIKACLALLLIVYLSWQIRHHLLRSTGNAIREIRLQPDGTWELGFANGNRLPAQLSPESLILPWLTILVFRTGSWWVTRALVLPPDSLQPDLARRLRVHLTQARLTEKRDPA